MFGKIRSSSRLLFIDTFVFVISSFSTIYLSYDFFMMLLFLLF